jgi:hypothetical protein
VLDACYAFALRSLRPDLCCAAQASGARGAGATGRGAAATRRSTTERAPARGSTSRRPRTSRKARRRRRRPGQRPARRSRDRRSVSGARGCSGRGGRRRRSRRRGAGPRTRLQLHGHGDQPAAHDDAAAGGRERSRPAGGARRDGSTRRCAREGLPRGGRHSREGQAQPRGPEPDARRGRRGGREDGDPTRGRVAGGPQEAGGGGRPRCSGRGQRRTGGEEDRSHRTPPGGAGNGPATDNHKDSIPQNAGACLTLALRLPYEVYAPACEKRHGRAGLPLNKKSGLTLLRWL